ncbi:CBS domain-containing protein [Thermococcus siculi]|uniref:CBS domain-containing protein n=1 Tax=Thermococcus siculi TaxID=72803 RepID=A0A2Z2MQJ0_9EURY|nr:CBS domain-containing protein [Thermococcus siculi]ASJ08944.1 CBS domain-containing protein [Thermococcus siculi]
MEVEVALKKFHSLKLTDIMPRFETIPVVTADTDLLSILKILRTRHHVWVVKDRENMELIGIIRYMDVIDVLLPPEAHRFKLGMTSKTMKSLLGGAAKAGDIAERHVLTIDSDETVLDAIQKMRKYRIQVLAVVDDGRLIGEVSLRILIDELLRLLRVGGAQWRQ